MGEYDWVEDLTRTTILDDAIYERINSMEDPIERKHLILLIETKAEDLKCVKRFRDMLKTTRRTYAKMRGTSEQNQTKFTDAPIVLNCGDWLADDTGVKTTVYKESSDSVQNDRASTIPILPSELMTNAETGIEKIRIDFYKNGGWRYIICERSKVASTHEIVKLADLGVEVNSENAKLLVRYIADCVSLNMETLPHSVSVSRMGWLDNQFVPYNQSIRFDGEREYKYLYESVDTHGSYAVWKEHVAGLRKNILLRLMMAASFASVIIERINGLPFVFHLWGGTGAGKTVAMMVAMSIWGNPRIGKLVRTMNMTANAMMSTAAVLYNLPFAGDELQTIKEKFGNYDKLIMQVTEGIDRGRMNYDKLNATRSWKNSFIFTGEEPCTQSGSGGGVINRVIEIECTVPVVKNGIETVNIVTQNYGWAGFDFVSAVNRRADTLRKDYDEFFQKIMDSTDTTEKQAQALAIMGLADKIACETIFTDDEPLTAEILAKFATSKKDVDVTLRAYEYAMSQIDINQNKFLEADVGEVWGRIEEDFVLVNKAKLVDILNQGGFDFNAVKSKWAQRGFLILSTSGRYIHQTKCHNVKGNYVKLKFIEDDEPKQRPF